MDTISRHDVNHQINQNTTPRVNYLKNKKRLWNNRFDTSRALGANECIIFINNTGKNGNNIVILKSIRSFSSIAKIQ